MSITTVKVLRTISKIVLLIVGIGIIGYGGLMVYKSVVNKPQRVRITNVTDSAATITWVTDNPVRGVVYYKDEGSFLPGPLGFLGSKVAYDDRDFARAQDECVTAFNENAKNTKDEDFAVDGNNFDCENIPVEKLGAYYTHSVTIKDLDDSSTYFFVVGNGIWSWKASSESITTFENLESIETPLPIFGRVSGDDESFSNDALVYVTFTSLGNEQENKVTESILYSSTTNEDGGWYVDASSIRDSDGNVLPLELGNDLFEIQAIYSNYGESEGEGHVFGYFETTVFDIIVEKSSDIKSATNKFIFNSYAYPLPSWLDEDMQEDILNGTANCNEIGPGNCLKVLSGGDGELSADEKAKITDPKKYGFLVNDLDYVANIQKICNCDDGEKCVNGSCVADNLEQVPPPLYGNEGDTGSYQDCGTIGSCAGFCSNGNEKKKVCEAAGWKTMSGRCNGVKKCPRLERCSPGDCEGRCSNGKEQKRTCKTDSTFSSWTEGTCDSNTTCEPLPQKCEVDVTYYSAESGYAIRECFLSCVGSSKKILGVQECQRFKDIRAISKDDMNLDSQDPTIKVTLVPVDLRRTDLRLLVNLEPSIGTYVESELPKLKKLINADGEFAKYKDMYKDYCKSVGGTYYVSDHETVNCTDIPPRSEAQKSFVSKAYAEEESSSAYTLYLPEYGTYSFELGDYKIITDTTDGETTYVFYVETNGVDGFQMPEDPDNPTEKEDIILKSGASQIQHKKVASAQSYTLNEGINLISFNFIPVSTKLGSLTAKGVIEEAAKKGVIIQDISSFDGGRWSKGYTCNGEECSGNDFNILPGKGYLVYVTEGGDMSIGGYELKSSVPVNLSGGWNLVGIHGYTTAYTARTLIDSMSKIDGVTANNVTWWPTSKGMYEGLQVTGEQEYGFDFPISPTNGYFVRISSFKPEDSKCKSLLWNEGGTLNGACGITK